MLSRSLVKLINGFLPRSSIFNSLNLLIDGVLEIMLDLRRTSDIYGNYEPESH